ncbi:hypothetical protein BS78_02G143900 [Paspalum vaginatum]|nr:hypothetical protein BS78_02G143900 [Paspalum vaginatum]
MTSMCCMPAMISAPQPPRHHVALVPAVFRVMGSTFTSSGYSYLHAQAPRLGPQACSCTLWTRPRHVHICMPHTQARHGLTRYRTQRAHTARAPGVHGAMAKIISNRLPLNAARRDPLSQHSVVHHLQQRRLLLHADEERRLLLLPLAAVAGEVPVLATLKAVHMVAAPPSPHASCTQSACCSCRRRARSDHHRHLCCRCSYCCRHAAHLCRTRSFLRWRRHASHCSLVT